jgi:hypothetical protein
LGGTRGAQRPVLRVNEPKKTGARSTRAHTRGPDPLVYNKGGRYKKAVVRFWSGTLAIEVSLIFFLILPLFSIQQISVSAQYSRIKRRFLYH